MQEKCIYTRVSNEREVRRRLQNAINAIKGFAGVWDINDNTELLESLNVKIREKILSRSRESMSSRQKISALVKTLFETESLATILSVLDNAGLSTIGNEICRPLYRQICSIELPYSRHLQTFYFRLKENIDNNIFIDKGVFLQGLSQRIKHSFTQCRADRDLVKAAGRLAIVTWLQVQHCKRDTNLIRKVLRDMRKSWPNGIDRSLCEIFYHSKMAIAAAMDEDISTALKKYREAKCLSLPFHDSLISALMCHDSRYTNQRVFMLSRSDENRRLILYESENGFDSLSYEHTGCDLFTKLTRRMFLLYIAQHYLKIENDLRSDERDEISQIDLKNANNALSCFDKTIESNDQTYQKIESLYFMYKAKQYATEGNFEQSEEFLQDMQEYSHEDQDLSLAIEKEMKKEIEQYLPEAVIDPRRAMIYFVCRARICEIEREYKMAELLLKRAKKLAQEGAHYTNEKENIRTFINRLILQPNH